MKKIFIYLLFFLSWIGVMAQDIAEANKVPTTYDRSSVTVLFLDFSTGNHWYEAKSKIDNLIFSDKYDNNNLEALLLVPSFPRSAVPGNNLQTAIQNDLMSIGAGTKIISKWYNRKSDGTMDMELVHERGRFTATDADFLRAQTSKRGNAALEEYGNRLINLSYILVIDINEIKTMAETGITNMKGWQASVTGYLYRISFDDQIRNQFYDTWIYDDDSPEVKLQKKNAFEKLQVPVVPVVQKNMRLVSSQPEGDTGVALFFKPKTTDELLQELVQKSYDDIVYRIEMEVEEFKVKTALYSTRPLRAKIGLKEGLKTDFRFFAYEYVYNSRTNKAVPKRRGVIRAASKSKIVDNRKVATGQMETSQFYQVHGRKLDAGYILQQQNDFGIEGTVGPEFGEIGGGIVRVDLRTGRLSGIRALFLYLEAGFDAGNYPEAPLYLPLGGSSEFAFLRYGAGLAKGFQLTRNVELRPYIGAGAEQATNDENTGDDALTAIYVKPGVNLALNLTHNFQITGGIGTYVFVSDAESVNYGSYEIKWNELFLDRLGPSTFVGIKIGF